MPERLVRVGTALAVAGVLHAAVNARLLRRPTIGDAGPSGGSPAPVAVLVPARNEAARIEPCVRSLVGQDGVREVVVVDDGSSDDTAARAAAAGARVVVGTVPPPGWLGKAWACAQLAAQTDDEVLVLVDADVRLEPGAVPAAVALLDAAELDVVCPFPRQLTGTPAERLVQPLLGWSWLTTLPLRVAERSPRPSLTSACGQFVVIRRAWLERIGGFAAVRDEVLDDLALVRAVKSAGGRGGAVDGSALAACRMYEGWDELRTGYTKSLWTAFGSPVGAAAVVTGLSVVYVLPAAAALCGSRAGALGYLAGVGSRVIAARAFGSRSWPDALAHPVSVLVFAGLTVDSVRRRRAGTLSWRGRPVVLT